MIMTKNTEWKADAIKQSVEEIKAEANAKALADKQAITVQYEVLASNVETNMTGRFDFTDLGVTQLADGKYGEYVAEYVAESEPVATEEPLAVETPDENSQAVVDELKAENDALKTKVAELTAKLNAKMPAKSGVSELEKMRGEMLKKFIDLSNDANELV